MSSARLVLAVGIFVLATNCRESPRSAAPPSPSPRALDEAALPPPPRPGPDGKTVVAVSPSGPAIVMWADAGAIFTDFNGDGTPDKADLYVGNDWFQESDSTNGEKRYFDERFERRLDGGFVTDTRWHRGAPDAGWRLTSSRTYPSTVE